ncbi:MAG: DMT family transporter [Pseudomonadota bacterium]
MPWVIITLLVLAGIALPFQPAVNAMLAARIGSGQAAAMVNFLGGAAALGLLITLARQWSTVAGASLTGIPWWMFCGGAIGALVVYASLLAVPLIGTAALVGILVTAQMITSVVIDHFGWMGIAQQPIDLRRLLGATLLLVGVYLLLKR